MINLQKDNCVFLSRRLPHYGYTLLQIKFYNNIIKKRIIACEFNKINPNWDRIFLGCDLTWDLFKHTTKCVYKIDFRKQIKTLDKLYPILLSYNLNLLVKPEEIFTDE